MGGDFILRGTPDLRGGCWSVLRICIGLRLYTVVCGLCAPHHRCTRSILLCIRAGHTRPIFVHFLRTQDVCCYASDLAFVKQHNRTI